MRIHADGVPPQPWKNGGGLTRELLAWPQGEHWSLRISLADIVLDGPFSPFPGVRRWFAVVEGCGVVLRFGEQVRRLTPRTAPLLFDGALAPQCSRIDGPTRDLNLMLRWGEGGMAGVQPGAGWRSPGAQCGLYAASAGRWRDGHGREALLSAHTLLWFARAPLAPQWFEPAGLPVGSGGWWLWYDPEEGT